MSVLFSICNITLQKLTPLCEKLEARRLAPRSWKSMRSKSVTTTKTYSKHSWNRLLAFENRHFEVDGLPGATTQCSAVGMVRLIYYRESHSGTLIRKASNFWRFSVVERSLNVVPGVLHGHQHRSRWFINKIKIVHFSVMFLIHFSDFCSIIWSFSRCIYYVR